MTSIIETMKINTIIMAKIHFFQNLNQFYETNCLMSMVVSSYPSKLCPLVGFWESHDWVNTRLFTEFYAYLDGQVEQHAGKTEVRNNNVLGGPEK